MHVYYYLIKYYFFVAQSSSMDNAVVSEAGIEISMLQKWDSSNKVDAKRILREKVTTRNFRSVMNSEPILEAEYLTRIFSIWYKIIVLF